VNARSCESHASYSERLRTALRARCSCRQTILSRK